MLDKYNPNDIESKWWKIREEKWYFRATTNPERNNFSIVIPPPNVTWILHMGHVLDESIQDVLVRRKRMSWYNTLWMPGTDHAGIATQNKVERALAEEWKTKEDLWREAFIERTWEWKRKHGGIITQQQRKLWASLDREKERFTMDEGLSAAVREIFVKLYNDNLIYQGEYMVNRCPRCGTALADDEVEHIDTDGHFWEIAYPIVWTDDKLILATTRPETMFGDTCVCVNPKDKRYKKYHGQKVINPANGEIIPIIADDYVDVEFGTGAMKCTPAHDPNDFIIGKKYGLEMPIIFNKDATMNEKCGEFKGLDRFVCREKLLEKIHLKKKTF